MSPTPSPPPQPAPAAPPPAPGVLPADPLRLRAEALLREQEAAALPDELASEPAVQQLLHNLRVHQIELQLQNDELRRAQAELEVSRARYFDLYELAPVGYCTLSSTGLILGANLTAARHFGLPRARLLRQPMARFVMPEDSDRFHLFMRQALAGDGNGERRCELQMRSDAGTPFWADVQAAVAPSGEGAPVLRLVLSDITQRQQAVQALAAARDAADAANRAKSAFLANMGHEIRTPMNAILGFNHLLRTGATPQQADWLGKIEVAGHHLLAIINDVLDLSKIESGHLQLENIRFDLPALLDSVAVLVGEPARNKGLVFQVLAADLPRWVSGDPTRLRQALLNYASNAVKFTSSGRIVLRAQVLQQHADDLWLHCAVDDSGVGIAAEDLPHLFQPFEQADSSISRRFGGTGLGLAITRRLVEMMGGEVGVNSQPGRGSSFWLTVRLQLAADPGITVPTAPPASLTEAWPEPLPGVAAPPAGLVEPLAQALATSLPPAPDPQDDLIGQLQRQHGQARLLVVDDNAVGREVAVMMLAHAGLRVDQATNGREALARVAAAHYDLVLMDVQMPEMDGLQAAQAIRELPGRHALPIIALTANVFEPDRLACLSAGMNDLVAKPVDAQQLYATLLKWLRP